MSSLHRVLVAGPLLEDVDRRDLLAVLPLVDPDRARPASRARARDLELELRDLLLKRRDLGLELGRIVGRGSRGRGWLGLSAAGLASAFFSCGLASAFFWTWPRPSSPELWPRLSSGLGLLFRSLGLGFLLNLGLGVGLLLLGAGGVGHGGQGQNACGHQQKSAVRDRMPRFSIRVMEGRLLLRLWREAGPHRTAPGGRGAGANSPTLLQQTTLLTLTRGTVVGNGLAG